MTLQFKVFRAIMRSWDQLFAEAADFATSVGPDRLVSISHSQEGTAGVVTVWYWSDETAAERSSDAARRPQQASLPGSLKTPAH